LKPVLKPGKSHNGFTVINQSFTKYFKIKSYQKSNLRRIIMKTLSNETTTLSSKMTARMPANSGGVGH
jgi:hypothetical protein